MKKIKYWLRGWFEYFLEIITWPIFAPYYKGIYAEKMREEFDKREKD